MGQQLVFHYMVHSGIPLMETEKRPESAGMAQGKKEDQGGCQLEGRLVPVARWLPAEEAIPEVCNL